jgi:hypothetical protein
MMINCNLDQIGWQLVDKISSGKLDWRLKVIVNGLIQLYHMMAWLLIEKNGDEQLLLRLWVGLKFNEFIMMHCGSTKMCTVLKS